jgi:DNA sulfur modification protein DndC
MFQQIKYSVSHLYVEDSRPWLVGPSGGKDSTMLAALTFDATTSIPPEQRQKPVSVIGTDTCVEIPAMSEIVKGTLDRVRRGSDQHGFNFDVNLVKPLLEKSLREHDRTRRPTAESRLPPVHPAIDQVNLFANQRIGHWRDAILHVRAQVRGDHGSRDIAARVL